MILLITAALFVKPVFASETVTHDPSFTYLVSGKWLLPTRVYESDDDWAYASFQGSWQGYQLYDFDSVLPENCTIESVEVGAEYWVTHALQGLRIRVSWDNGENWSDFATLHAETETLDWVNATGLTSWNRDKLLDANLRVEINYVTVGGGCFGNDMLVTMANFEYETIKGLSKGDKVLRYGNKTQIVTHYQEHDNMPPTLFFNITTANNRSLVIYGDHEIVISESLETKTVNNLTLNDKLLNLNGSLIAISSIEPVLLTDFTNLCVSQKMFYVENFLVHNLLKEQWTCYLDWLPVRVNYSIPSEVCIPCLFVGLCFVIAIMIAVIVLCDDKR